MLLPRCLPPGVQGPCRDPLMLDNNGYSRHPRITNKVTGNIAKGDLVRINGIIVHQTGGSTAQSTFNSYNNPGASGAHFLIARDGKIYQTASVYKKTWHVGKLRSRCVVQSRCPPVPASQRTAAQETQYIKNLGPRARHNYEKVKSYPARYPMNEDSLGIELVGKIVGNDPAHPGEKLYETVMAQQNTSLTWIVQQLAIQFGMQLTEVFRHPTVSQKTPSEAATADWTP